MPATVVTRRAAAERRANTLKYVKISDQATAPRRGTPLSAGYDLASANDCIVRAGGRMVVPTHLQIKVPEGCYGRIAPRSGLAVKSCIDIGAGVIDADYRGPVGVVLLNFGTTDFQVKKGDYIAQLICERISYPELKEVDTLDDTERGANGFGSTDSKAAE